MATLDGSRSRRFELVTAAHRFVLAALPLRQDASERALLTFVEKATAIAVPPPEVNAVLLQLLSALHPYAAGRLPTLIDRYLALAASEPNLLLRFRSCVQELLRYRGIRNPTVRTAVSVIHHRYSDPALSLTAIAREVGRHPDAFGALFKLHTGISFRAYVRGVRLDRAALLLATTDRRVKEVWVSVGYNDAANFDHDFVRRLGCAPREYRARAIRELTLATATEGLPAGRAGQDQPGSKVRVLIVDDDEAARQTLGHHLRLDGYAVSVAATAGQALQEAAMNQPHVLLLDYHLPDMDGLECLRLLRRRGTAISQPEVVLLTADWTLYEHGDEIRALDATITSKPCTAGEIERRVQSLCASSLAQGHPVHGIAS